MKRRAEQVQRPDRALRVLQVLRLDEEEDRFRFIAQRQHLKALAVVTHSLRRPIEKRKTDDR